MTNILYLSDNLVALNGPVDRSTGAAVSSSPTSCVARLYDESKETVVAPVLTRLTTARSGIALNINVPKIRAHESAIPFFQEMTGNVTILDDSGALIERALGSLDTSPLGYDTLAVGASSIIAAAGNPVHISFYSGSQTQISIPLDSKIEKDDVIEITSAAGVKTESTVDGVAPCVITEDAENVSATTAANHERLRSMRVSPSIAASQYIGARIRVKLGSDITMTSFGSFPTSNPVAGDTAWGFRGTIIDTIGALKSGMKVRIEIEYDGGAGLKHVTSMLATVLENSG